MKRLVCEMCGGTDLVKHNGVFVCQTCGTKYSVEEAKKMMIEGNVDVSGSIVKVDNSEKLQNLYQLARRAKDDKNSENAQKYYEQIAVEDPNSWEASFYGVYYTAMNCKIGQIGNSAYTVKNSIGSTFELIREYVPYENQKKAYDEVATRVETLGMMLINGSMNHYMGNMTVSGISSEISGWNGVIISMVETLGDKLQSIFEDKKAAVTAYKTALELKSTAGSVSGVLSSWETSINNKIIALDATYKNVVDNQQIDKEIESLESRIRIIRNKKKPGSRRVIVAICMLLFGIICMYYGITETFLETIYLGLFNVLIGGYMLCIFPGVINGYNEEQKLADSLHEQVEELKKKKINAELK